MPKKTQKRVTRSISFERPLMDYCKKRAKAEGRTVNWIVNDCVRKHGDELKMDAPAAAAASRGS